MHRRWAAAVLAASAGFSVVETSAVLAGSTLLAASAAPQVKEYVESARQVKAAGDVRVIAGSIIRLMWNVGKIGRHQRPPPQLLIGAGETPQATTPDTNPWTLAAGVGPVQPLEAHLVDNAAGYSVDRGDSLRWRGPYLEGLSADPWGRRYAVNVGLIEEKGGRAVFVLSPGPNGTVETPYSSVGIRVGGDDVIGLVGSGP